jgi:hypothetical protein
MKKLILSAAILLGSLSTFAQTTPEEGTTPEKETTTQTTTETTSQSSTQTASETPEGYTEVKLEEVPAAVTESLKKSVPDAKLVNAYINEKKQYKLKVEVGDKVGSLDADENGKWINQ